MKTGERNGKEARRDKRLLMDKGSGKRVGRMGAVRHSHTHTLTNFSPAQEAERDRLVQQLLRLRSLISFFVQRNKQPAHPHNHAITQSWKKKHEKAETGKRQRQAEKTVC